MNAKATDRPPEADTEETGQVLRISKWRIAVALMFACIIAYIGFVGWRAAMPSAWEFSVEAETEVAEFGLRTQSSYPWQVDGAILCTRTDPGFSQDFRLAGNLNPCGSRAWRAWQIDAPEQILELGGDVTVLLNMRSEGGLAMSVRAANETSVGAFSVVGLFEDVPLGSAVNLIWPEIPARSLTFPFAGTTTLGRSVGWSNSGMLVAGDVSIYTADNSADKRTMVDTTSLMLGDQIRMGDDARRESWPKGFAYISAGDELMRVIAFGRADSLRIERYGESGYELKPGNFRKLASDPTVAFLGSLLAAYMTLILGLQPFIEDTSGPRSSGGTLRRLGRWLRRDRG